MKRFCVTVILFLLAAGMYAQHMPVGINYQAVARDNLGNELKNQNLNVRLSIIAHDPTGEVEYAETHSVTTDNFGLFNLVIGAGAHYAGSKDDFTDIDWASSSHFLKVEVDFGQGFISMGTMQFLAVPYALYAATAGNTAGEKDMDKDPENELQVLSLEGQVLKISQGNSITLSDVVNDADADPENERQDLQITQDHKLKITNNPSATTVDLSPYLDNTDEQTLAKNHNTLTLSGSQSTVTIDGDTTNEQQDLRLDHNQLTITKNPDATPVDLNPYLDNTDNQTLVPLKDSLHITGGNTVAFDPDTSNEMQSLTLNGYELKITGRKGVNIRPEVIAFRAIKSYGNTISVGDSAWLTFDKPKLEIGCNFSYLDGKFTVPDGGEGLYSINITYDFQNSNQVLSLYKNGTLEENVIHGVKNYEFLLYLNDGDYLQLSLKITALPPSPSSPAVFSGYRIH